MASKYKTTLDLFVLTPPLWLTNCYICFPPVGKFLELPHFESFCGQIRKDQMFLKLRVKKVTGEDSREECIVKKKLLGHQHRRSVICV